MVTLVAFESLAVITILPHIADDLGGIAWYGWVTTAFFLGTMIGIVFAGEQADRHGAGRPYVVGLLFFATDWSSAGWPSMPVLVVGRFVQGLGAVVRAGDRLRGDRPGVQRRPTARMFACSRRMGRPRRGRPGVGGADLVVGRLAVGVPRAAALRRPSPDR